MSSEVGLSIASTSDNHEYESRGSQPRVKSGVRADDLAEFNRILIGAIENIARIAAL